MFWWKFETKTINNIIFKRIKYGFTEAGLKEVKELLEEKKIIKNIFSIVPESSFGLGTLPDTYTNTKLKNEEAYRVYVGMKEKNELFKTSIYLVDHQSETEWEEVKNEKKEPLFINSRREAFENFKIYGVPTVLALLTLHKLRKRGGETWDVIK